MSAAYDAAEWSDLFVATAGAAAALGGLLARLIHGIPLVVTAHSIEPLRPWKREQLGRGADVSAWAERAAIREFEGGQSRDDAERDALDDVRAAHRRGPRSASVAVDADAKKRAT